MDKPAYGNKHPDEEWGCIHTEITSNANPKIHICQVNISDLKKVARELANSVMDNSWIMNMDKGASRSYIKTASDTANRLVEIFNASIEKEGIASEFGQWVISIGSSRSLKIIFQHTSLPIAELWKPQELQNEGFDFHTVCKKNVINFGEAKFKSANANSPVSDAANQANSFFSDEKHLRDRVHLVNLVNGDAISNLDQDIFGMVVAFSMNAQNPLTVYTNAISKVESLPLFKSINSIYIVGVTHGN